jgi:hypothetical protein
MFFDLTSGAWLVSLAVVAAVALVFVGGSWVIAWFVSHRD